MVIVLKNGVGDKSLHRDGAVYTFIRAYDLWKGMNTLFFPLLQ